MNPEKVSIQVATTADVESIVRLNHLLFQEDAGQRDPFMNLNWALDHGRDYFTQQLTNNQYRCWLAHLAGEPVGYLIGYLRPFNKLRPVQLAELESMFVLDPYRRSGLGSILVEKFFKWAKAKGCQRVSVSVYAANDRAVAFYQQKGFQPKTLILEGSL